MESGDRESRGVCGIQLLKTPTNGMDQSPLRSRFHRIQDVVEESSELARVERRGESLKDITWLVQLAQQLATERSVNALWRRISLAFITALKGKTAER
jgi:hypothetical protein